MLAGTLHINLPVAKVSSLSHFLCKHTWCHCCNYFYQTIWECPSSLPPKLTVFHLRTRGLSSTIQVRNLTLIQHRHYKYSPYSNFAGCTSNVLSSHFPHHPRPQLALWSDTWSGCVALSVSLTFTSVNMGTCSAAHPLLGCVSLPDEMRLAPRYE